MRNIVMKPRAAAAIVLVAAVCALIAWNRRTYEVPLPATRDVVASTQHATLSAKVEKVHAPVAIAMHGTLHEDSLRGTEADGAVNFDANGRPRADRDLRRLFDYFLTRLGERSPAAIRLDLLVHLRDSLHLDTDALTQVLSWFDSYTNTQRASSGLARSGNLADDFARMRTLHREQLGEELARAFYGDEDDYAAYTAQRLALERDPTLTPAQRDAGLTQLEAQRDPMQRVAQQASTDFQLAVTQTEQFAEAHADGATRYAERAALWGEDAAQRLALLDEQEAQWSARLAAYARARADLLADTTLTPDARAAGLSALLSGFQEPERLRVLALVEAGLLPKK